MNLQDLQNIWHSADDQLDKSVKINRNLFKEVSMREIRIKLREIKWQSYFELIVGVFFAIWLIGFMIDHGAEFQFLFPAGVLLGITLFDVVFNIYKLTSYYQIDSRFSVLQTQKTLEKLKYYEAMGINVLLVIIPLFSGAFLIVMAKAIAGFDLYVFSTWLTYHVIGSVVVALILVFILRRFPNRKLEESITFLKDIREMEG
jgi:membrane protein implicated in regulation of membrane protease activity